MANCIRLTANCDVMLGTCSHPVTCARDPEWRH